MYVCIPSDSTNYILKALTGTIQGQYSTLLFTKRTLSLYYLRTQPTQPVSAAVNQLGSFYGRTCNTFNSICLLSFNVRDSLQNFARKMSLLLLLFVYYSRIYVGSILWFYIVVLYDVSINCMLCLVTLMNLPLLLILNFFIIQTLFILLKSSVMVTGATNLCFNNM